MVIRVDRNSNYTTMANFHLRDKELSLKAKGLMSFMLSLPEDWDYSVMGLVSCLKESRNTVRVTLQELEHRGYLTRNRIRDEHGLLRQTEYILSEQPKSKNPTLDNPTLDNSPQLNTNITNISNTNVLDNTKYISHEIERQKFTPPSIEEVNQYIHEKGYQIDAQHFIEYYEAADWHFANGKPVKNWKQCLVTWNKNGYSNDSRFKQEVQPTAVQQAQYFSKEEYDKRVREQLEELYTKL